MQASASPSADAPGRPQGGARGPNVLLFLTDQESQRVERGLLRLPNRERLERGGVRFERNWCAAPQCSPARAALLSGRYPHRTGVLGNVGAAGGAPLRADEASLGNVFRKAGYRAGYFGKWHLSQGSRAGWEEHGFEAAQPVRGGDAAVAEAAARWIAGAAGGPWLCVVSLIQPHDIYDYPRRARLAALEGREMPIRAGMSAPASGAADLNDRPRPQRQYREDDQGQVAADYTADDWRRYRSFYYELIEDADRNLGKLLDAVEGTDTVVAHTSDHGDGLGAHGLAFKGPFLYEELLNVPLTVSRPGLPQAGAAVRELTTHADVLPTLCDLAGIPAPPDRDGRSLRPLLEGTGGWRRDAVFAEYYSKQRWANPARAVRDDRWKLVEYLRGGRELYDLVRDPSETENLAGAPARREIERELLARLDAWAAQTYDALWFRFRPRELR